MAPPPLLDNPLTATDYAFAQHWCEGHQLGDKPALDAVAARFIPEPMAGDLRTLVAQAEALTAPAAP